MQFESSSLRNHYFQVPTHASNYKAIWLTFENSQGSDKDPV